MKAKLISRYHIDMLINNSESKKPIDCLRILLIFMLFKSLQCNIKTYIKTLLRLLLVKSLSKNHMVTSSCYQCWLIDKRIYLSNSSKNCLFLLIRKTETMIHILLLLRQLKNIIFYKFVKVMIDALNFEKVILNVIICYYSFLGYY